jgi:hypothetical protein
LRELEIDEKKKRKEEKKESYRVEKRKAGKKARGRE